MLVARVRHTFRGSNLPLNPGTVMAGREEQHAKIWLPDYSQQNSWMTDSGYKLNLKALSAVFILFVLAPQVLSFPTETLLARALNNFAHTPWFLIVTLFIWLIIKTYFNSSFRNQFIACCLLAFALSVASEALQIFTFRQASLSDIARNCLGAMAALSLVLAIRYGSRDRIYVTVFCSLLTVGFHLIALRSVADALWQKHLRAQSFPVLADFNRSPNLSSQYVRGNWLIEAPPVEWATEQPQNMAKIHFNEGSQWPGVILREPFPDWSKFQTLIIDAYLDAATPLTLTLRVETFHDRGQDSTTQIRLLPGTNKLELPLIQIVPSKDEPATRINAIHLFGDSSQAGRSFYLASIRLGSPIVPP